MTDANIRVYEGTSWLLSVDNSPIDTVNVEIETTDGTHTYSFIHLGGDVVRFPNELSKPGQKYYDEVKDALRKDGWTPYIPVSSN